MNSNLVSTLRKNPDGSVSEHLVLNGNHITLIFAPDSEQESSEKALQHVRETLFRELTEARTFVIPPDS